MSDDSSPRAVGPYTPVRRAGGWIVTSGQIGVALGPAGFPEIVPGGTAAELIQALSNLKALLDDEGVALTEVVKTTVFLIDMADYGTVNAIWMDTFGEHPPTRSAVAVSALPLGARVEVEAWAYVAEVGSPPR